MSKLPSIQALRALAALSVAMLHAQHEAAALAQRTGASFTPGTVFPWTAGVDVFFVISGFIMVHSSGGLFAAPGAPRLFLARRLARIAPLYWAATTLFLVVALAAPALLNSDPLSPLLVLASYLFIPMARPDGSILPLYGLGWTLNYEMFFYALFAAAIVLPRRNAVIVLTGALAGLVLLGRILAPLPPPLAFWTDPIILEFGFGMVLGLLRSQGFSLPVWTRILLAFGAVLLLWFDLTRVDAAVVLPRALAHGGPAALLVAAAGLDGGGNDAPGLPTRMALVVGDASYALYLIHPFVIRGARELLWLAGVAALIEPWSFIALSLAAAVIAALFVFRWFESPLTGMVRRRLGA